MKLFSFRLFSLFLGYCYYTPATYCYVTRTYEGPSYKVCSATSRSSSDLDYSFYFWDTTIIHQQLVAMLQGPTKALVTRYGHETLSHLDYSFYFWDTAIIHQQLLAMLQGPMKALVTRYALPPQETLLI